MHRLAWKREAAANNATPESIPNHKFSQQEAKQYSLVEADADA
jgi:hypothetical protein